MASLTELLFGSGPDEDVEHDGRRALLDGLNRRQAYCLYISHFLSMWNSRMYEFGVVSGTLSRDGWSTVVDGCT